MAYIPTGTCLKNGGVECKGDMKQELSYRKQIARQLRTQYVEGTHIKVKDKGLVIAIATYMSQTRDQRRFTISEVAADWHEPLVPQRITWPSIARANG